ncbi:MAG TPA: hypothetical protein VGQ83_06490 [Polyangia bacterium]
MTTRLRDGPLPEDPGLALIARLAADVRPTVATTVQQERVWQSVMIARRRPGVLPLRVVALASLIAVVGSVAVASAAIVGARLVRGRREAAAAARAALVRDESAGARRRTHAGAPVVGPPAPMLAPPEAPALPPQTPPASAAANPEAVARRGAAAVRREPRAAPAEPPAAPAAPAMSVATLVDGVVITEIEGPGAFPVSGSRGL